VISRRGYGIKSAIKLDKNAKDKKKQIHSVTERIENARVTQQKSQGLVIETQQKYLS